MRKLLLTAAFVSALLTQAQGLKQGELSEPVRLTSLTGQKFENPSFSPDGNTIAFTKLGYDGLFTMNADGSEVKQLSDAMSVGYKYQWSADGAEILVRDTRWEEKDGGLERAHAIWSIDRDGNATRLSEDRVYMQPAAWRYNGLTRSIAVDGEAIEAGKMPAASKAVFEKNPELSAAYEVSFIDDFENLYVVDALGNKKCIYTGAAFNPQLSPDGTRVAFVNMESELRVMNIDGTNEHIVTSRAFNAKWLNNDQLIFERTEDDGHTYTAGELVMVNAANGVERNLTSTPGRIEMCPSVSPDGSTIVFVDFYSGQVYKATLN